jgi:hypothetical protein
MLHQDQATGSREIQNGWILSGQPLHSVLFAIEKIQDELNQQPSN